MPTAVNHKLEIMIPETKSLFAIAYSYRAYTFAVSYRTQSTSLCDIYCRTEHTVAVLEASTYKHSFSNFLFNDKKYFNHCVTMRFKM